MLAFLVVTALASSLLTAYGTALGFSALARPYFWVVGLWSGLALLLLMAVGALLGVVFRRGYRLKDSWIGAQGTPVRRGGKRESRG
jgi:hypothetical protein